MKDEDQRTGISKRGDGRGPRENTDIVYTHGRVHIQTEVGRNSRSKKILNEGLQLNVPSIYNECPRVIVIGAKTMNWSVRYT